MRWEERQKVENGGGGGGPLGKRVGTAAPAVTLN
jgi:hypothetical protein